MYIILLSGGVGKRLWPLSHAKRAKQFIQVFTGVNGNYESMEHKKSGVYIEKPPYDYNNVVHLLEIESDGGIIRTSLLINK